VQTRSRRTLSALVAAALVAVSFGVGPSAEAQAPTTEERLQQLLAFNPGAKISGPDSIVTPEGVTLSLPASRKSAKASAAQKASAVPETVCSFEHLCLFSDAYFEGEKLTFGADCNLYPIWQLKTSKGKFWGEEVSSYVNNQKAGTWAYLWHNYGAVDTADRDNWELVEGSKAPGKGLAVGVDYLVVNDYVNVVRPCPGT
jgi:hypothetical protein